jgi:hypothetical protein
MKRKFEQLFRGETPRSLINDPIEPETALERARRRWGMPDETQNNSRIVEGDNSDR